jgi:hypothetical protein
LRFSQYLLHRADFEDLRTADWAGPLSRKTSILYRDLLGAGVAKATLYALFGNKEGLVRAYLMARDEGIRRRMTRRLAR